MLKVKEYNILLESFLEEFEDKQVKAILLMNGIPSYYHQNYVTKKMVHTLMSVHEVLKLLKDTGKIS